jgi:hypothetical protein
MHQYYIIALIQQEHVPVFDNDLNTTGPCTGILY